MVANTPPTHSDSFENVGSDRNSPATADGDSGQLPSPGDLPYHDPFRDQTAAPAAGYVDTSAQGPMDVAQQGPQTH